MLFIILQLGTYKKILPALLKVLKFQVKLLFWIK
jgi:hypothetical protein